MIVFLIVLGFSFTSCKSSGTFMKFDNVTEFDGYNSYTIFKVLNEKEGLASVLGNSDAQNVVYIISDKPIYNAMRIKENEKQKFKMIGTFSYKTSGGDNFVVPVIKLFDVNSLLSTKKSISFFEIVVKSVNSRDFLSQRI